MKYIVIKETKRGKYYIVKALLLVKGQKRECRYTVSQKVKDLRKLGQVWKLTRSQMRNILENTHPDDWLIRKTELKTDENFRPLSIDDLEWILNELKPHKCHLYCRRLYYLYYWPEKNEFEATKGILASFYLKPKDPNLVRLVIPPELKKELLVHNL